MTPLFESTRRFQVWLYSVSHAQLLLRANPRHGGDERIEVLFKAVRWMGIPTVLDGLTIREVERAEVAGELPLSGAADERIRPEYRFYVLEGAGYRGVVVALAAFVHTDTLADHEPSGFSDLAFGVHLRP